MNSRLITFALGIGFTLYATFLVWDVVQRSYIPAAVQVASERGARLPAYQIVGIDLASSRIGWMVWSALAIGAYWLVSRRERKQRAGIFIFLGFAAPLGVVSALLIVPLLT